MGGSLSSEPRCFVISVPAFSPDIWYWPCDLMWLCSICFMRLLSVSHFLSPPQHEIQRHVWTPTTQQCKAWCAVLALTRTWDDVLGANCCWQRRELQQAMEETMFPDSKWVRGTSASPSACLYAHLAVRFSWWVHDLSMVLWDLPQHSSTRCKCGRLENPLQQQLL